MAGHLKERLRQFQREEIVHSKGLCDRTKAWELHKLEVKNLVEDRQVKASQIVKTQRRVWAVFPDNGKYRVQCSGLHTDSAKASEEADLFDMVDPDGAPHAVLPVWLITTRLRNGQIVASDIRENPHPDIGVSP